MTDVIKRVGGDPVPSTTLVNADQTTITGDGSIDNPLVATGGGSGGGGSKITLLNGGGATAEPGAPVYSSASGAFELAQANDAVTTYVLGLAAAAIGDGSSGNIITSGPLTLTTTQWDAITGQVGGLTFNTQYWVSPTTAGVLTDVAPNTPGSGDFDALVGIAVSTTTLLIGIAPPIGPL
jgi:hypothetical protein